MTSVAVYSYSHSVTYVADNILKSLKDIIRLSGLDPSAFTNSWQTYTSAVRTWLESGHLKKVVLEIYDPNGNALIIRWDVEIVYGWTDGDSAFWTDTEQLKYAIRKARVIPSAARYELIMDTKPGRPDVPGWSSTQYRSTTGMVQQSVGTTIEHNGLSASTTYFRKL